MKRYEIAGLAIDMEVSGRTYRQAEPYAMPNEGVADMTIVCDAAAYLEKHPHMKTEDMAEYMATAYMFARRLLDFDGMYLHASAVILEGKAYLFSAPSGTGKSTHTEKWCRLFGAELLNDDKPALRLVDGIWMAYGTPWSGKYDLSSPRGIPLGGIAFLQRGEDNVIERMDPAYAVRFFLSQTLRRLPMEAMQKQLTLLDKLLRTVPIWELTCRNEDSAACISRDAMVLG